KKKIQNKTKFKSLDYFKKVYLPSLEETTTFFKHIKRKLIDVNHWNEITKAPSATFTIVDASGHTIERPVKKHDYIRIDIPGPGLPSAKGYDWVHVEDITETANAEGADIILTLRPCADPTQEDTDTGHFFKLLAT